jgi:hypothetical protein
MKEQDLPNSDLVVWSEQELGGGRWYDYVLCVFKALDNGLHYAFYYDVGKTEHQDVDWWENLDEQVSCTLVELRQVMTEEWRPVED